MLGPDTTNELFRMPLTIRHIQCYVVQTTRLGKTMSFKEKAFLSDWLGRVLGAFNIKTM